MEQFINTETLIIELLLIATLVAIVVRRLRIPYTVALVIVGLLLTAQSELELKLTPELILALFIPPLIFEAAFHLNLSQLQSNLTAIVVLAVPGVIISTSIIGFLLFLTIPLSLPYALLFGSLIAATDPVAVVSLFRILGVPKRLSVLIEGESLFNDGTAIVLFNLILTFVVTGQFNLPQSIFDFIRVSIGGVAIGIALGWVISRLIARVDDYLIETTLTTVLAYGSYLVAEQLHFSGVLAVVAAGLINGNIGPQGMSPTTRVVIFNFWEYLAFLVNSLVFLLIGLQVDIPIILSNWKPIIWAILAVLIARIIVIYGLGWLINRWSDKISLRWQHVIAWGGLRGAISLALALSLPLSLGENANLLRTMAFGVVLFTLLVQATSMNSLIRRLNIIVRKNIQIEYEMRHARLVALRAAESYFDRKLEEGLISHHVWETIKSKLSEQNKLLADMVRETMRSDPTFEAEELDTARREVLRTQRSVILSLQRDGIISDETYERLTTEIDSIFETEDAGLSFVPQELLPEMYSSRVQSQVTVEEITVDVGSYCENKKVREISWPRDSIIVSLQRGDHRIIPRGDTVLETNDVLLVIAGNEALEEIRKLCKCK